MKAIIMVAGMSTRTHPLTLTKPKPLLKVMNKPILAHQLDALDGIVDTAVLVVGYRADMVRETFGNRYKDIAIEYVEQKEQLGTGHAALQCAECVDTPFMVLNGDDLYAHEDLARLAKLDQAALAMPVDDARMYAELEVRDGNRLVRIVEKPKDVKACLANIGAYKFTPAAFEVLKHTPKSERGEIEITSAVQTLAETSDFRVVPIEGYWLPTGYPWHLLDVNEYFLNHSLKTDIQGDVSPAAHITGAVSIGRGTVIRPGVVIDGPVCIGENCTIGPNAWLRPGTTIGDNCRIGQAVEVKNSIFMDHAAACHLSYIGDSVVGEHTNLGCGTITANVRHDGKTHTTVLRDLKIDTGRRKLGAIIADNVHTGIHTSILPGRKLWPGTSTQPGEVVRKDVME